MLRQEVEYNINFDKTQPVFKYTTDPPYKLTLGWVGPMLFMGVMDPESLLNAKSLSM
jgi:hypothetical protein